MTLHSGFQPSLIVRDPTQLFGHNQPGALLDQLSTQLLIGTNTQILGERRSGKTSLLRCIEHSIQGRDVRLLPVYVNFREHPLVNGYGNAHRLLLAHIHCASTMSDLLDGEQPSQLLGSAFATVPEPISQYEALLGTSDYQIDRLLEEYVLSFLGNARVGVVLLLDEYEHLMRYTYGAREGSFFKLRKLSSEPATAGDGPKPLTYVVAGSLPWDQLCDLIGSPELNNIGAVQYVSPLEKTHFAEMWNFCIEASSGEIQEIVRSAEVSLDEIYELTGGWPFFGKIMGDQIVSGSGSYFGALEQHFNVIWTRLSSEEQHCLVQAERGVFQGSTAVVRSLSRRGLLDYQPAGFSQPRGNLWARFVRQAGALRTTTDKGVLDSTGQPVVTDVAKDLQLMVDEIANLVTDINEISLNCKGQEVFVCSNQDLRIYTDLRKQATAEVPFGQFTIALYNLVFERTTGAKLKKVVGASGKNVEEAERNLSLARLPKKFQRKCRIVRVVDSIRHHYGKAHVTRLPTFNSTGSSMDIGKVLDIYLGSPVPAQDYQFLQLQTEILKELIQYLKDLKEYLRDDCTSE